MIYILARNRSKRPTNKIGLFSVLVYINTHNYEENLLLQDFVHFHFVQAI